MRFRALWGSPSFTGYLEGHSFWRTVAYSAAAGMGRDINAAKAIRAESDRVCRDLEIKTNLIKAGILSSPLVKRATPHVTRHVAPHVKLTPTRPPDTTWRPTKRHIMKQPLMSRPAAVKPSGGLRGSTATKWR